MAGAGHYGEGDAGGEKSAFRWIDAARYTVAAVVLVLIVAVIVNAIKLVNGTRALMTESYFDELYNGNSSASIRGVTARLDGVLVTEVAVKDTTRNTTYYCGPVLVVHGDPGDAAFQDTPDAPCTDQEQRGQLGSS
ncbi:unnamed protein product [Urochloa decumbens]|uniref:Uncharacterized protein n=1 Tax=Urochloa decumbens TaxID=240449 RepID=A0ABC9DC86_9POAL